MAETIRDVIIRLRIEQQDIALRVPDTQPILDAINQISMTVKNLEITPNLQPLANVFEQVNSNAKGLIDNVNQSLDLIKQRADSLNLWKSLEVDDATVQKLDQIQQATTRVSDGFDQVARSKRRAFSDDDNAGDQLLTKLDEVDRQGNRLRATYQGAGEGFFRLSRGLALANADTSDSFKEMLHSIAAVQAGYDVFAGSQKIIKTLTEFTEFATIATEACTLATQLEGQAVGVTATTRSAATVQATAAAVAETELAAATVVATGANYAWAVSFAAVGTTVAVLLPYLTLVSVIVSAGIAIWAMFGKTAVSSSDLATEAMKRQRAEAERLQLQQKQYNEHMSRQLGLINSTAEKQKLLNEQYAIQRELTQTTSRQSSIDSISMTIEKMKQLDDSVNSTAFSQASLNTLLEKGVVDNQSRSNLQFADAATKANTLAFLDNMRELQSLQVDQIREEIQANDDLLGKEKERFLNLKDTLDLQKKQYESITQTVGALSKSEFNELKNLTGIVQKGGTLNEGQEKRLGQIGGPAANEFLSKVYQQRGEERGAIDLAKGLGISAPTKQTITNNEKELSKQGNDLIDLEGRVKSEIEKLKTEEKESLERLTKTIIGIFATKDMIDELQRKIERSNKQLPN